LFFSTTIIKCVLFFLCSEINKENDDGKENDEKSENKGDDDPHDVEENDDGACKVRMMRKVSTREMRKMTKATRSKMMIPMMLRRMMMEPAKVRMMSKVSTREMRKMAKATKLAKKIRRY
jgi:hypothetical protein